MRRRPPALGALALAGTLAACTSVLQPLRDNTAPPGLMKADGTINPCHGDEPDHQRCGDALFHARHITKIAIGSGPDDVRRIMHHDPEERSLQRDGATVTERWTYLTDYRRGRTTIVVFVDGRVTGFDVGMWTK